MKGNKENRNKWLHLRLTEKEWQLLRDRTAKSVGLKVSDYARKMLLSKPIVGSYRNRSLDDFMEEMIVLRKELNHIGNNFNQAVHKLHISDTTGQLKTWITTYELQHRIMLAKVEEIKVRIAQISDRWLAE